MLSTMQDRPLTIGEIFRHGATVYSGSEIITCLGDSTKRATFSAVSERAARLASALQRLGIRPGDRVGTFAWNTQEHVEGYFAIPSMGAVLHTINIRLSPEQIVYVINHAEDRIVLVDDNLTPALARVAGDLKTVERYIVMGGGDTAGLPNALRYEDLLAGESGTFAWPDLDERSAAAMCYTSGTTGNPKGVVYSHRSSYLHALAVCAGNFFGLCERDRILPIVPMFHANSWGLPHAAWLAGADLILPGRFLQAEPLCRLIAAERPTFAGAVPTVWNDLLRHAEGKAVDLSSLRMIVCGGSAVPRALMERFQERYKVPILQAWGMTETSPLAAFSQPPKGCPPAQEMDWRTRTGRIAFGVDLRIVSEGKVQSWDGKSVGEIEVRGPWVTGSYYREDDREKFDDGWLRTGDVGAVHPNGYIEITDRAKDVVKSGGEWISSVELENALMAHAEVREAAVIAAPDERWGERPLACVVRKDGSAITAEALQGFLAARLPRWWIPERWAFVPEIPRTSVGKMDKKVLRARYAEGTLKAAFLGKSAS